MLKKDYIMRMLQEFMEALLKMLDKNEVDKTESFNRLYTTYFKKEKQHFDKLSINEIIEELKLDLDEQSLHIKMEMLSELMYYDAVYTTNAQLKLELLNKTLELLELIDIETKTYSAQRLQKIQDVEFIIGEINN